ncbi:CopG family transcriptional regulator [Aliarcobacter cryaerophilus]|jgi:predicted DNA-binding protein|uniref:CopG family transcriptional regulator n=1 Tax=Aliarcobacter cryaerophilus TaxID=28198 RepID=A0A1V9V9B3_9BACT|nr:CopG family transcriptional regulator [Aliarcobacter cryaerophilus]MCT7433806.1 CopG family transcriptional regulator [Aliarcobacter cryaerophilus]MCT7467037.1 CopG family transcriptional regulator [Aliarcobacter cryaerophilus]MCT7520544.1 CopG family transcriptional regulator [Aliarcobacter cryaerophilus]MCT7523321.1 CopG family transcriptional regulator [Aliarcobacter cryaerophilus]MCT7535307.1 CopG family transcriptional regulator [Aliarcobacter cryaerophilus]
MIATVRLDENLENTLNRVSKILDKKKSEVIREAIIFYSQKVEQNKKNRLLNAIEKTKDIDKKYFEDFEGTTNDGF